MRAQPWQRQALRERSCVDRSGVACRPHPTGHEYATSCLEYCQSVAPSGEPYRIQGADDSNSQSYPNRERSKSGLENGNATDTK